ncbi:MAG: TonB-dependent receptor [Bryobacterales bacterium]|nr:TonB-dependent receptor [Bryobacterales bacterium]
MVGIGSMLGIARATREILELELLRCSSKGRSVRPVDERPGQALASAFSFRVPLRLVFAIAAALPAMMLVHQTATEAAAQSGTTTGIIRGTVVDPLGDPVAGAVVMLQHRETDLLTTVETSSSGTFARTLLPPGTYDLTVKVETAGFSTERIEGATLRVGEMLDLAVALKIVTSETVTVVSELPPTLDAADVTSSQRVLEDVVDGIPSNGRNFLNLTLLTPGTSISQGSDGDELNISGQRGIFNNLIVDGADFNNPFFGEQRGGQRPAFTFNQDAIEELVVVNQGATAEFGRSAGGFITVITKSGTNELSGSAHYFGQWDEIAAPFPATRGGGRPDFHRNQLGATLGGPLARDRVFFFLAYDQQAAAETKQATRHVHNPANLRRLERFLQTRWPGLFDDEFGPIRRTDDARALLTKLDLNLDGRHQASIKYNYTWSEQVNGTFDVDSWGASANGIEGDRSHAVNASLRSLLTDAFSNELRVQMAREDRPRWYQGPLLPGARLPGPPQFAELGGRPFPDIGMDFADGFRIGLPFFLPIDPAFDTRFQVADNVSFATGAHLFKAGVEYNRTLVGQQFIGLANSRYVFDSVEGFIGFVTHGDRYVTCSDGSTSLHGACPPGSAIAGPVLLYLQSATGPGVPAEQLGSQEFPMHELGVFVQDTWHPHERVTLDIGLRWDGTWHPDVFIEPAETFFAPYLDDPLFPSDGRIPDDLDNLQPRFGLAWDLGGNGRTVLRANAGSYVARIPMLVFAQHRTTNGAFQQTLFRSSSARGLGPVPAIDEQIDTAGAPPFLPDIQVADRNLELPRTWSFSSGIEQDLGRGVAASIGYIHARTDHLFRFFNRNDAVLGAPFGIGTHPSGGGINTLTVTESSARSRYHAFTAGLRGRSGLGGRPITFEAHYTLAFDRSDDDNERDPFTLRYAHAANLAPEYGWSDRDRRHQVSGYMLAALPARVQLNQVVRYLSASPVSEQCANRGERAVQPADRICADGSILRRNTLRRQNGLFSWDLRVSRRFALGATTIEPIFEIFNLTNADNFVDPAVGSLLFNFDGSLRSGLGDTRRAQAGLSVRF